MPLNPMLRDPNSRYSAATNGDIFGTAIEQC